jgi:P2X purinoceptor 4
MLLIILCLKGAPTGNCIQSSSSNTSRVCEIYAWCPVENKSDEQIINGTLNYTIFIRNNIEFDKFQKKE